jgi:hypothetical protein
MRTTLTIEDDALSLARALAERRRIALGKAVSELVRRGAAVPTETVERNGLTVVRLPKGTTRVTAENVSRLLDELP